MIGKLRGLIDYIDKDHIILDVNGVGYICYVSTSTIERIGSSGDPATLIIDMHVREDAITLFGFLDKFERDWFRNLLTVKGVGGKVALAILGSLDARRLNQSIMLKDKTVFTQISGIGPKLAERIISELKDKVSVDIISGAEKASVTNIVSPESSLLNDAISALSNLGYNKNDAYTLVCKIMQNNPDIQLGELIRLSLKDMAK